MDQNTLRELQEKLKIAKERILQEEYEMFILRGLFESKLGEKLVLKGGTALRLAYGSPRFSDDLDFSILKKIPKENFTKIVITIANRHPYIILVEARKKYHTLFALFKVTDRLLKLPFSIKVEVSIRKANWQAKKDYKLTNLKSTATNFIVLGNIATLERIKKEKLKALKQRQEPKDLYDLWFVTAKLGKEFKLPAHRLSPRRIKQNLNKYLPEEEQYVLRFFAKRRGEKNKLPRA